MEEQKRSGRENAQERFSVGELARLCGVTVRTLQYYDRSGLLRASFTQAGRRFYTRDDLLRLQQILFYKALGFPLEEIGGRLLRETDAASLVKIFTRQRDILQAQIEAQQKIASALELVIGEARERGGIGTERLLAILRLMKEGNPYAFIVRYFSDEQFREMSERFDSPEACRNFMERASELFERLRRLDEAGEDPSGPEGRRLASDWWAMAQGFAGGNPGVLRALVTSGEDMGNWPKEAQPMREVLERFLVPAMAAYFAQTGEEPGQGMDTNLN